MKAVAFLLTLVTGIAGAALPPYYESARQMAAILASENVAAQFSSADLIHAVAEIDGGFVVAAGKCSVDVKVKCGSLPEGVVGPCPLILSVGQKTCEN